jgi:phage FluMu protein Com
MKPGDKVICINDNNLYHIPVRSICAGIIYTITEVFKCKCGNIYVRLAEVDKYLNMWCPKCDTFSYVKMYFHIERFRLLEQAEDSESEYHTEKVPLTNPNG